MPPCGANRRRPSGPRDARRPDRGTPDPAGRRSGARGQGQKTGRRNGRALRGGAGGGLRGRAKSRPRWGGFCIRAALLCTPGGLPARRGRPRPVSFESPKRKRRGSDAQDTPPKPHDGAYVPPGAKGGRAQAAPKGSDKGATSPGTLAGRCAQPHDRGTQPARRGASVSAAAHDRRSAASRAAAARPIFGRRSPVIGWPRPKSGTPIRQQPERAGGELSPPRPLLDIGTLFRQK